MGSLAKAIKEFHSVTSGRHPGSPGQNATSTMPHPTAPADHPHIRADSMTEINFDTSEENSLQKVDEIVPNRERADMQPSSLPNSAGWDKITSYKLPSGMWHHVGEKMSERYPGNLSVHHILSSSSDPTDIDSTVASIEGGNNNGRGFRVAESSVDSEHRRKGFGRALYHAATQHHGALFSGDSISKAAHSLYHSFIRDKNFDVQISDKGSEERHKLTHLGPKPIPTKVWTKPTMQKSEEPLDKAMPRYIGEVDPVKEHVAVPHPVTGLPTWQHQPAKAKNFQAKIDQNLDRFSAQFGEHGPALKAGLTRGLANKKHADLVVTTLKPGGPQVPRRRHIAYLVSGDPASKIKHLGGGEFLWRQERHGESDANAPVTYWKINHQGIQDVTAQHQNNAQDFVKKSDKGVSTEGVSDAKRNSAKSPDHERPAVLGGHGQGSRPLTKADDERTASARVDDPRSGRPGGQPGGTGSGQPAPQGNGATGINQEFEVPGLAGSAEDSHCIYVDRRLNPTLVLKDGRTINVLKYLKVHERVEKVHEDMGYSYQYSHEIATGAERRAVEADNIPWMEYQNYMLSEVKRLQRLNGKTPPDIDLQPERDYNESATIHKVRELQKSTANIPPHGNETQSHWLDQPAAQDAIYDGLGAPQIATVAVMDPVSGAILMGRRHDTGRWTNPGGQMDKGETPHQGAIRELREETGIHANKLIYLGSGNATGNDGSQKMIHCFMLLGKPAATSRNDPDEEVGHWYWVNIQNNRLPESVMGNLQSPRNVLLKLLGLMS